MTQHLVPQKTLGSPSPFLSSLMKRLANMPPHQEKIFKILDQLTLLESAFLPELYLKDALSLLSYASPSFIQPGH